MAKTQETPLSRMIAILESQQKKLTASALRLLPSLDAPDQCLLLGLLVGAAASGTQEARQIVHDVVQAAEAELASAPAAPLRCGECGRIVVEPEKVGSHPLIVECSPRWHRGTDDEGGFVIDVGGKVTRESA